VETEDAQRPSGRTSGGYEAIGGRLLGRWELLVRASYWVAWLSFSRRTAMGTGIQRDFDQLGMGALRLIIPASLLVGVIATFQVATQLSQFGAQSLSVRAIGWFAARELGPVVVALLIVTRSASGIAGELATMRANGEIDALRAMGLNPVKYLVAPKLAALLIAVPGLTILADALITLGGWLGSIAILDVSTRFYFDQFRAAFELRDLFIGLVKSVAFAYIIAVIACHEGLNVEGKMQGIGAAASRAVVYTVLGVLALDTIINAVFYFIPVFA
jgi:phospholipid/cholesterol/gamma-HCH transport system permease protein